MPGTPPLLVNLIKSLELEHIDSKRNLTTTGLMFLGNTPPIDPADYQERLDELATYWTPNSWENTADFVKLTKASKANYDYTYKGFVNSPLESGAPDGVRGWYDNARSIVGLPPAPPAPVT